MQWKSARQLLKGSRILYIYICLSTWTLQWPFPFKNSERVLALFVASMHLLEIGSMLKGPEGSKSRCLQSILLDKYHYQKSTPKWYHTEFFLKSIFFQTDLFRCCFLGRKVAPKNHVKWTLWTLVSAAGAFEKSACAFCDSRMAKNEALKKSA